MPQRQSGNGASDRGDVLESEFVTDYAGATRWPLDWNERLARALIAHSADVILVLTAGHRCLFANPAVLDVLGYPPEAVLGQDVVPLHHPDDLPRAVAMLQEAAANPGRPAQSQIRLHHHDGSWRWMAVTATNRLLDPAVGGIVCNVHDITAHVESVQESEQALREEELARSQQERLTRAKSDFLHMLVHEFKTPLTVIFGNAELLEMEMDAAQGDEDRDVAGMHESTRAIRGEARRLSGLLDDLLFLDRIDADQLALRVKSVDINHLVAETIERMRGVEPERPFMEAMQAEPSQIEGDGERLRQILVNLLSNAMKFSHPQDPITIATSIEGDGLWISVSDRGLGIVEAELPFIFDRYRRAESGEQRGISSSGLGLAIVKEIAQLHGGRVRAESQLGTGPTVSVWLPFALRHDETRPLP